MSCQGANSRSMYEDILCTYDQTLEERMNKHSKCSTFACLLGMEVEESTKRTLKKKKKSAVKKQKEIKPLKKKDEKKTAWVTSASKIKHSLRT